MAKSFYFSHDYNARNDKELVKVSMKMGMEGIGVYWCIIEMLYEENGYLMLSECDSYAFALRVDIERITQLINDYNLFEKDDYKFWSNSVIERLKIRDEKSNKARESASKRWERNTNAMRTHNERNAIKERKGKEIKEKDNIYSFDQFWKDYDKKIGDKTKIENKFNKLTKDELILIKEYIPKYKQSQPDKQFRKNPETFLNNKSWNDEIITQALIPQNAPYSNKEWENSQPGPATQASSEDMEKGLF
jgi:hypothetical protein